MKQVVKLLLFTTILFITGSCIDAPEWSAGEPMEPDHIRINFELNAPEDFDSPETGEDATTRAMDYAAENTIASMNVLIFDQNDLLTDIKLAEGVTVDPVSGQSRFTLFLPGGGTRKLVVLANSAAILSATIGSDNTSRFIGSPYADVVAAIWGGITGPMYPGTPPSGRIPMWGETPPIPITTGTSNQTVQLARAVSRIDVGVGQMTYNPVSRTYSWNGLTSTGATIPFRLAHVYIMRPGNRYSVIPAAANRNAEGRVTAPTVPAGTTSFTVAESQNLFGFTTPAGMSTQEIYIPESNILLGTGGTPGDINHVNRTAVVVGGYYNNSPTETFYRIDFANSGTLMNVLRNHLYQFSIANVAGAGFPTVTEAYTQLAMNMAVSILAWNQTDMGNIMFDGNSFFAIDRQQVHFTPSGGQTETVNIRTNIANFGMVLDGATRLQVGGATTYTSPTTGFVYTLTTTGPQAYSVSVNAPNPNISATPTTRTDQWNFVANRLNLNFVADQQGASDFTSVVNGQSTVLFPEGTNGNNIPLNVISRTPVTVTVAYSPGSTGWVSGIVSNPPQGANGYYSANMSLTVPTFVYGTNGTADRTATITITPQGGTPTVYTIVQQAPYITLSPNTVNIPRPATPGTVTTPVKILTNILPQDLVSPPAATSPDSGLTWLSAPGPYTRIEEQNSRNQQFNVVANMNQAALDYTGSMNAIFTVTANVRYGNITSRGTNSVTATVGQSRGVLDIFWFQTQFQVPPAPAPTYPVWTTPSPRFSDATTNYVFPWNTTRVDFDVVSNMSPTPDPAIQPPPVTTATPVDRGNGIFSYPYTYFIPQTSYANNISYTLRFYPTRPQGESRSIRIQKGVQYFRRTGSNQGNVDFRGTSGSDPAATITIQSNVNWTASLGSWAPLIPAPGSEWVSMRLDQGGFTSAPLTQDNRVYAPVATATYNEGQHLLGPNHTMFFSVAAIPFINPASGFANGVRAVVVSWNNNNFDNPAGTGGAAGPPQLVIIQYAPILRSVSSTLPTGTAHIPYLASTYSFTANTNLQGWGVMAYLGPRDATGSNLIAIQDFASQNPGVTINSTAQPQNFSLNLTIPANTAEATRDIYFYMYSSEFPDTDPALMLLGMRTQDYWQTAATTFAGANNFLYFDGAGRLRVGKQGDGQMTGSITTDFSGNTYTSNQAFFKFGSVIGFDGNGQNNGSFGATTGSIRFNPSQRTINGYGDILTFNAQPFPNNTTPGFYVSDPSYMNYDEMRNNGRGDPCRLAGYLASEVRSWTRAQFDDAMTRSEWRIATARENALYVGGNMANQFDPTNPSTANYSYMNGTSATTYNFVVPQRTGIQMAGVWLPVARGETRHPDGTYVPGTSIRRENGTVGVEASPQVNYWSGTSADGTNFYCTVEFNGNQIYPVYQRGGNFGMIVRCVHRNAAVTQ